MQAEHVRAIITEQFLSERESQENKWGADKTKHLNKFYIGHPDMFWTVTLGEQFGEISKAVSTKNVHSLYNELIKCGATCMGWAEGIQKRMIDKRIDDGDELLIDDLYEESDDEE